MNLDRKISVLKNIIKHFKEITSLNPNLITDLNRIRDMRNKLAHLLLHTDLGKAVL